MQTDFRIEFFFFWKKFQSANRQHQSGLQRQVPSTIKVHKHTTHVTLSMDLKSSLSATAKSVSLPEKMHTRPEVLLYVIVFC